MRSPKSVRYAALVALICSGALTMPLAPIATTAAAQEAKWWERLPGFGTPEARRKPASNQKKNEPLDDLRKGPIPLRSDEMLDMIKKAVERYKAIVKNGGWPKIGVFRHLRPGDDHEAIPSVRRRLIASGDIPQRAASYYRGSFSFDEWLEQGVKAFQLRHGLRVTGRLDRSTRAQLAVTAEARLRQLELNGRRIAALIEGRIEERYILVNVPAFQLEAVERFEVKRRHRVIVGKPNRQTPAITATIRGLNFFPYWHVPDSVSKLDLIPRLQKEPDYLRKEHIRVLKDNFNGQELDAASINWKQADYKIIKFRQDPGPWNALGLVRINMPNKDIVYMHDTPMKPLFKQRSRAFSAGCVRVQNVMELASWIAKYEPGFSSPGAVDAIVEKGHTTDPSTGRPKEFDVNLIRPLPVLFTYITAWAERGGRVEFRPDIYGRDGSSEFAGERDPDDPPPPMMLSP
ncbi:MAG: L,D-transpeptidase family protein [Hyphomicrobiaceae bacterium]|nr:L,D-transpeptidase family protein [Hyphomicrobiaceae bacterium]